MANFWPDFTVILDLKVLVWFLVNIQNKGKRWHRTTATLTRAKLLEGACFYDGLDHFAADFLADLLADSLWIFWWILRRIFWVDLRHAAVPMLRYAGLLILLFLLTFNLQGATSQLQAAELIGVWGSLHFQSI